MGEVLENKTRPVEVAMANIADFLPSPPEAPQNLKAIPSDGKAFLAWDPPANDGGSSISKYQYQYQSNGVLGRRLGVTLPTVEWAKTMKRVRRSRLSPMEPLTHLD